MDFRDALWRQKHREQLSHRFDKREQLGSQDMALTHVDNSMRHLRIEAEQDAVSDLQGLESRTAATFWRRKVWQTDLSLKTVLRERRFDTRNQIAPISLVIGMLELTSPALGKVRARRILMVRAGCKCAIVKQRVSRNAKWHM